MIPGDIVSVALPGQRLVILNSLRAASDLLDKRSAIYSGRPTLVSAQAIGYAEFTSLQGYGPTFRAHRKMLTQTLGPGAGIEAFEPMQLEAVHRFLAQLMQAPEDYVSLVNR